MTFLRSIIITVLVALGFAFGLKNILGFWETFALAVVFQFLIAFLYNSTKISRVKELTNDFQNELDQLLSLDETFKCEKCGNEFRIDFSATPTLLTQPVYTQSEIDLKEGKNDDEVKFTSDYKPGKEL